MVIKHLWGEQRVTLQMGDGSFRSLPIGWTELAPVDPYMTIGKGRSKFRVKDLIELVSQVREGDRLEAVDVK